MFRIIIFLFLVTMIIYFSGCSNINDSSVDIPEEEGFNSCQPVGMYIGTAQEGWYYNCDGTPELLMLGAINGQIALCLRNGTRYEGWYTSLGDDLIAWCDCLD